MSWTWWMTLAVIALVLVLIACIPVGVDAQYSPDGAALAIRISSFRIQILPQKQKKARRKKTAAPKKQEKRSSGQSAPHEKKENPLFSGGLDGLMQLLDFALETLGDLRRKLRVNELTVHVLIGGSEDPAKAAMNYGRAWAAIGVITPMLERLFVIKKRDIRPALDYNERNMQVCARLVTTITIGRALALALRAGFGFLKILNERKKAV